jgi:uncharacterized protein
MPEFAAPIRNHFCWIEMQARDPVAAREFYDGVFGWTYEDMVLPEGRYTMARAGGKLVAGLLPQHPTRAGSPAAWYSYIAVDDVKASSQTAVGLGGTLLMGPMPLGTGTVAVLADPTGGVFLLWQTNQPMGSFLYGEPGALTWNELVTTNADVAQRFYTKLLGWKAEAQQMASTTYTVFKVGESSVGGLLPQPESMKGAHSCWAAYFAVTDADATFATAARLGAKVLMPLADLPEVGRFGWLQDPQGAPFAIIKNAMPG